MDRAWWIGVSGRDDVHRIEELGFDPVSISDHGEVARCVDHPLALRERYGVSHLHLGANLAAAAPIAARPAGH